MTVPANAILPPLPSSVALASHLARTIALWPLRWFRQDDLGGGETSKIGVSPREQLCRRLKPVLPGLLTSRTLPSQ